MLGKHWANEWRRKKNRCRIKFNTNNTEINTHDVFNLCSRLHVLKKNFLFVCILKGIRGLPFIFRDFGNPSNAICQLTALSYSLTFLRLYFPGTFWLTRAICVAYSNLKGLSLRKNGIKSWTFSCDLFLQLSMWINSTTVDRWT